MGCGMAAGVPPPAGMRPSCLLFSLMTLPAVAQPQFTFGVTGGVPAQTPLGQTYRMPFALGPTVNFKILPHVSIETGVIFQRLGQQADNYALLYPENALTLSYGTTRARALDIPVLAKIQPLGGRRSWRPFVTLGPTIRRVSVDYNYSVSILTGPSLTTFTAQPPFQQSSAEWRVDPTVGAGLEFKAGRFHLSPEVRYSYWGASTNLPVRKNQVNFLFAFRL